MRHRLWPALFCLIAAPPALAQEAAYVDDRSSPAALVTSLYNAINRGEHARAMSYFAERPAETVQAFAETFSESGRMRVVTGSPLAEGEGAERRFDVPLAVAIESEDGATRVLAGCYDVLDQATDDAGDFLPYRIAGGLIEPVEAALEDALPVRCGEDGPDLPATDIVLQRAQARFEAGFADICLRDHLPEEALGETEIFTIEFRRSYESEMQQARLFRFFCTSGAYNQFHVHFLADETGELMPVNFVVPELDIRYEDEQTMEAVRSIDVIGYTARPELVNSTYDPDTLTMTAHSLWRGVGDASASGKWIFRSGAFTLVRYDVDATLDGQINPETIIQLIDGP
ncbi:MAG: DUF1176 domain-containing protein [Mesorhizobium sp.]|nr:DUF1176 domain-containing protein [Mesorhizobium sp.]